MYPHQFQPHPSVMQQHAHAHGQAMSGTQYSQAQPIGMPNYVLGNGINNSQQVVLPGLQQTPIASSGSILPVQGSVSGPMTGNQLMAMMPGYNLQQQMSHNTLQGQQLYNQGNIVPSVSFQVAPSGLGNSQSLMQQNDDFVWQGSPIEKGPLLVYSSVRRNSQVFKSGGFVLVRSPGDAPPFVARIVEMWEDFPTARKGMMCQWFYRKEELGVEDVDTSHIHPNEVFLTNHQDPNALTTIVGPARVVPQRHQETMDWESADSFFYARKFLPETKQFRTINDTPLAIHGNILRRVEPICVGPVATVDDHETDLGLPPRRRPLVDPKVEPELPHIMSDPDSQTSSSKTTGPSAVEGDEEESLRSSAETGPEKKRRRNQGPAGQAAAAATASSSSGPGNSENLRENQVESEESEHAKSIPSLGGTKAQPLTALKGSNQSQKSSSTQLKHSSDTNSLSGGAKLGKNGKFQSPPQGSEDKQQRSLQANAGTTSGRQEPGSSPQAKKSRQAEASSSANADSNGKLFVSQLTSDPDTVPWRWRTKLTSSAGVDYYTAATCKYLTVKVGDCCLFRSDDPLVPYVGRIISLFDDPSNKKRSCRVRWFYRRQDTSLGPLKVKQKRKMSQKELLRVTNQVFPSFDEDDNFVTTIEGVVSIRNLEGKNDEIDEHVQKGGMWFSKMWNSRKGGFENLNREIIQKLTATMNVKKTEAK